MSTLSQFGGGGNPVGAFVYAPYNITDPAYLLCNGAKLVRTAYPLYAALQPVGTFTPTTRTKGASSASVAIFADSTNFIASAAANTSLSIQTSPDAVTWTTRTTPNVAGINAILGDGTNIVAVPDSTGVVTAAIYSANSGVAWTATATAGVNTAASAQPSVLCQAPTLGTVGRFLLITSSGQVATSDDRGVTWTVYSHGTGFTFLVACWTGTKYIALTTTQGTIMTSTTGLTGSWTAQAVAFPQSWSSTLAHIVSDGAGKVLIVDVSAGAVTVSTDSMATYSTRSFASNAISPASTQAAFNLSVPSYANGRFFSAANTGISRGFIVSADLTAWLYMPDVQPAAATLWGFAFKSGVYLASYPSTQAMTLVEDNTKVYLPAGVQSITGQYGAGNNFNTYVKVK